MKEICPRGNNKVRTHLGSSRVLPSVSWQPARKGNFLSPLSRIGKYLAPAPDSRSHPSSGQITWSFPFARSLPHPCASPSSFVLTSPIFFSLKQRRTTRPFPSPLPDPRKPSQPSNGGSIDVSSLGASFLIALQKGKKARQKGQI